MTTGEPARPVAGRLVHAGGRLFVLDMPLPTSLPIPLGVTRPSQIALLTWAFAGLSIDDPAGPRALLVLAAAEHAWKGEGGLTVATHFRDIAVEPAQSTTLDELALEHRALLARAVLSSVSPAMLEHWPDLIGLIGEATDAIPAAPDAPEIIFQDARACTLAGTGIPNHLLLRVGRARSLARVATATVEFGDVPRVALGLDYRFGTPPETRLDGAIGLCAHGFTVFRPRAA